MADPSSADSATATAKETNQSIAPVVRQCLEAFKALGPVAGGDRGLADQIDDEFGRFRIWAGNVSAHSTGRRSLDHRLRDSSELRELILKYLNQLKHALVENAVADAFPQEGDTGTIDSDSDDDFLFDHDELVELKSHTPLSEALLRVSEINTCLLRISMSLRNPARSNQVRYAEMSDTKHFEPHDISHVQMKFPQAPSALVERLGKSISKHRQYFKYRESHHLKLVAGLDADDGCTVGGKASTKATSLNLVQYGSSTSDSDIDSVGTATSYAATLSGDSALRPPPRPEAAVDGKPFECPLCWCIVTASDERSWRQHVYEDLPPYVCVDENCQVLSRQFARRKEWRRHMQQHQMVWNCPHGCFQGFATSTAFRKHLNTQHSETQEDLVVTLLETCGRTNGDLRSLQCPLCLAEQPNQNVWHKHVGHHLEQLALFAVPQHLVGEESDQDSQDSNEDGSVLGSASQGSQVLISPPIVFRDALGRWFPFPWQLCRTWKGMEGLIKQAFIHVDVIGDHVQEGHYDLTGPGGEIILPEMWGDTVQPGCEIQMHLWPMPEEKTKDEGKHKIEERPYRLYGATDPFVVDKERTKQFEGSVEGEQGSVEGEQGSVEEERERENSERQAEEEFESEMRERLQNVGYTEHQIESMMNEERTKTFKESIEKTHPPIYAKVHQDYLAVETLKHYEIPWECDPDDPHFIIILREMSTYETEILFAHTRRLRLKKGLDHDLHDSQHWGEPKTLDPQSTQHKGKRKLRNIEVKVAGEEDLTDHDS